MAQLTVIAGGVAKTVAFEGTPLVADLLRAHGYEVPTPCGGKGVCGKCAVQAEGSLSPPAKDGRCLACSTRLTGDAVITLAAAETLRNIALSGDLPLFDASPVPGRYGLAVDIGTTTLAAALIDLRQAKTVVFAARRNPQREIADNVIGRIEASLEGAGSQLQASVRGEIDALKKEACQQAGIDEAQVDATVITGNTTMLYLWEGRNPLTLSRAPFEADWLAGGWAADGKTYLPRCIGAFLGADIVCAVLASRMTTHDETVLLIDIGTNGEIALWHQGRLYCCATAAGPAFEGGGIRDGVGSVAGAVDTVRVENGKLAYTTIADAPPIGICGSGLIDAAASLLALDMLDETGSLDEDEASIAPGVALTGQDIRKLQLAKGAVAAGIRTLCRHLDIALEDIGSFYIAGGFGAHLNMENAAQIGLIPRALRHKAVSIGNAALAGAMMMLMRQEFMDEATRLADHAEVITLSGSAAFSEAFVDSMMFEEM